MYGKIRNIHFVGIGGIGMSGIAEVLLNLGYRVSGSDLRESEITQRLARLGGCITLGHAVENLQEADVVVTSTAVRFDNPEVLAAKQRLIPVIPRAEMLAELMRMKYGIAVAGAHGKTTTTSMIATVLSRCGIDPTAVIGGRVDAFGSNAKLGQGEFLVAEADESDGSFLRLSPTIAVVTNIDEEHLDYYRDLDHIKESFTTFINKIPFYGLAVLCLDNPNVQPLIPQVKKRFVTYGLNSQADYCAFDIRHEQLTTTFVPSCKGDKIGEVTLNLPGKHNVLNALATIAVSRELDLPFAAILEALNGFGGVQRRFQIRHEDQEIMVVDDYGHHPTEVKATLAAARSGWDRRLVVVFQPHRYTRTRALFEDFLTAFYNADLLILMDIYPAGEDPIEGISARTLAEGISRHGHRNCVYRPGQQEVVEHLLSEVKAGDMVLTLGAGNVYQVGDLFLHRRRGE
ncbi:MAG: UDP-N-acetylmuramate--L-alanine ligase [Desulfuromonadaceae bacterium]|nr:UDP-N-acetylmuramate--L-alanine ligase [Desulfuromonadaceae bacterium]